MKYYLWFFAAVVTGSVIGGCSDEPQPPEGPALLREQTSSAATVSEPLPPSSGEGNFEGLVADYESKDRVIWQKPDLVIAQLGNIEGKTIADIGAGTGYFTFRMVPRAGKVIGIDIDQRSIQFMDSIKVRLPEPYRNRFEARLALPDDPLLLPGEADNVIIVNTYPYIENRVNYLRTLRKGMAPKGLLLIIDFKKNNLPVGPPQDFKVAVSQVERELRSAGFKITKIDNDALDYQYIVLASNEPDNRQ